MEKPEKNGEKSLRRTTQLKGETKCLDSHTTKAIKISHTMFYCLPISVYFLVKMENGQPCLIRQEVLGDKFISPKDHC